MSDAPIEEAYIDISHAIPKPPNWVIRELIPVGLTVLSGPPKKSFKSLQALLMAVTCARWPMTALPTWMVCERGGPSLIHSYEADAGVCRYILEHDVGLTMDPGAIYIAHDPRKFQLDVTETANRMLDYMYEKEPILTVLDPFRNMHSGDENDSANIQSLLAPLVTYAHETDSAVVMVHHVNKPSEGKDQGSFYNMRGSSALPGLADGLLTAEMTRIEGNLWLNATYKRGLSYRRQVHLGVPGYGWGTQGFEVYDDATKKVKEEWDRNASCEPLRDPIVMAKTLNLHAGQVKESIETLQRNNDL